MLACRGLRHPVLAVLAKSHPLADRDVIDPASLAPHEWINTPVTTLNRPGDQHPAAATASHRLDFEGDDFRAPLKLVAENLGVALLPELALVDAPSTVTSRPLITGGLTRHIYACRLDTRHVSAILTGLENQLANPAAI
jgi:DNA-binding transcriptional LysR family regulator